jgi:hypothetical protein
MRLNKLACTHRECAILPVEMEEGVEVFQNGDDVFGVGPG